MPLYYPPSTSPGAEAHDPLLYRGHAFVERDTRDAATGRDTGAPPDPGGVTVLLLAVSRLPPRNTSRKVCVPPLRSEMQRRMEEIGWEAGQYEGKDKSRSRIQVPQEIWVRLRTSLARQLHPGFCGLHRPTVVVTREGSRRQTFASPQCCDRKVQNAKSDPKTTYHLYVEDCIDAKGNLVDLKDSWPKIYFVTLRPPGPRRLAVPG